MSHRPKNDLIYHDIYCTHIVNSCECIDKLYQTVIQPQLTMHCTHILLSILVLSFVSGRSNRLLVILLDGFRPDYLNHTKKNGGFQTLMRGGVTTEYVKPGYPSESYPGYYAIATGLWGENSGFPSNLMYDPKTSSVFKYPPDTNSDKPFWWEKAEPIWITTTKNNISSASFRWPGANIPHHGIKPKIATPFAIKYSLPLGDDIEKVLNLFASDEIRYAQVYSEFTDIWGHLLGPEIIKKNFVPCLLDPVLADMVKKIRVKGLNGSVNVVIVSDHGMARSDFLAVKTLRLQNVLNPDDVEIILLDGAHVAIVPIIGKEEKVYNDLQKLGSGIDIYWKKDLPKRYHIKNSDRIPQIFGVVKKGFFLDGFHGEKKQIPNNPHSWLWEGYHGYDPKNFPEMNAIFIGWGPDFKKGLKFPPIDIVDTYNLLTRLIGVNPHPNNGTWSRMANMTNF